MSAAKPIDDLEAVRTVVEALSDFEAKDIQRIFRWASEKLGVNEPPAQTATPPQPVEPVSPASNTAQDIKSFVAEKDPRSDIQFAATVAYYYRFVASDAERKDTINKDDILNACRIVSRQRPLDAGKTLNNAFSAGLLDRVEKGMFSINSVGENLVVMTLPGGGAGNGVARKKPKKKASNKNTTSKKALIRKASSRGKA